MTVSNYGALRRAGALMMICGLVAGCSAIDDPAKVCAAAETQAQVRTLLGRTANDLAAKLKGQLPAATGDFADAQHGQAIKLDLITLTSSDKTTKKITCAAQASINVAPSIAGKLKEAGDALGGAAAILTGGQVQLTYSRQPQASGDGFVYSLDNADSVATLAMGMLMNTAFQQAKAQADATQLAQAAQAAGQPVASSSAPAGPNAKVWTPSDHAGQAVVGSLEIGAAAIKLNDVPFATNLVGRVPTFAFSYNGETLSGPAEVYVVTTPINPPLNNTNHLCDAPIRWIVIGHPDADSVVMAAFSDAKQPATDDKASCAVFPFN